MTVSGQPLEVVHELLFGWWWRTVYSLKYLIDWVIRSLTIFSVEIMLCRALKAEANDTSRGIDSGTRILEGNSPQM